MVDKWAQNVEPHKGALHRALHIPEGQKIPAVEEREILRTPMGEKHHGITVTATLKDQIDFALNVSGRGKKN
jgi:hypothetical protein